MKIAGLSDWVGGATAAAFCYPLVMMCGLVMIDLIEWAEFNVMEWPITTMVIYGAVWMVVNIIACYFGALEGYRRNTAERKKPSPVARKIPKQPSYLALKFLMPLLGAVQFACIFVELQYIWNSVWRSYMYAMYWSLMNVMILLAFVVAEISVVATYF